MKLTHAEFAAKYPKVAQAWALCCAHDEDDPTKMWYTDSEKIALGEEFAAGVEDLSIYVTEETLDPLCWALFWLGKDLSGYCDDNDHLEMEYPTWPELAVAEFCAKYPALSRLCGATPENIAPMYAEHADSQRAEILAQKIPAERVEEFFLESEDPQVAVLAPTVGLTEDELNTVLHVCECMSGM